MTKTYIKVGDQVVDSEKVTKPSSRLFRDAWQLEGDVITVDMVKAREIKRDQLRADREPILAELDAQFMKALETNQDISGIVAHKTALRDAPNHPSIEKASTIDELKDITIDSIVGVNYK